MNDFCNDLKSKKFFLIFPNGVRHAAQNKVAGELRIKSCEGGRISGVRFETPPPISAIGWNGAPYP